MKSIRAAKPGDLQIIQDLAHEIWPHAYGDILSVAQLQYMLDKMYSLASLQHQLLDSLHSFILVFDDKVPVGFASFSPKKEDPSIFHLYKIYVLPRQQGTGTGKMLLEYIISRIKEMGATSLELNVNRHNKARYFYEKQGFLVKKEVDIDIGQGFFMNDYIMQLKLK
jgi:GNAT superfamily N-acetyltransferase